MHFEDVFTFYTAEDNGMIYLSRNLYKSVSRKRPRSMADALTIAREFLPEETRSLEPAIQTFGNGRQCAQAQGADGRGWRVILKP